MIFAYAASNHLLNDQQMHCITIFAFIFIYYLFYYCSNDVHQLEMTQLRSKLYLCVRGHGLSHQPNPIGGMPTSFSCGLTQQKLGECQWHIIFNEIGIQFLMSRISFVLNTKNRLDFAAYFSNVHRILCNADSYLLQCIELAQRI